MHIGEASVEKEVSPGTSPPWRRLATGVGGVEGRPIGGQTTQGDTFLSPRLCWVRQLGTGNSVLSGE